MRATYQGFSGPVIVILTVLIVGIGLAGWTWQQAQTEDVPEVTGEEAAHEEVEESDAEPGDDGAPTIDRGVYGTISLYTGNCMPSTADRESSCEVHPVETTVLIREPVSREAMAGRYVAEATTLVERTHSDEDGWYEIALPPGVYSVFVEDGDKEYCQRSDDRGRMCPIVIEDGVSEHNIDIDHAVW